MIRIFPSEESAWWLLGAFLAERQEEWSTGRRYLKIDEYYDWKENFEPDTPAAQAAA